MYPQWELLYIIVQPHKHTDTITRAFFALFLSARYSLSPFKILELLQQKENFLVHVYLFIGVGSLELDKSINRQLAQSDSWSKTITQKNAVDCSSLSEDAVSFWTETPNYSHKVRLPVCSPLPSLKPSCESSKGTSSWSKSGSIMSEGHRHTRDITSPNASPARAPPGVCVWLHIHTPSQTLLSHPSFPVFSLISTWMCSWRWPMTPVTSCCSRGWTCISWRSWWETCFFTTPGRGKAPAPFVSRKEGCMLPK